MDKEIIYDKTSEEYKAIKLLESKTTNYSDDSLVLHYNIILYNLIINLMKKNKKQKEINQKAIEYIKERFYFNEETGEYALLHTIDKDNIKELLDILNEV